MTLTGIDSNAISVCLAAYTTFSKKKRKNCPEFKKKASKQTNANEDAVAVAFKMYIDF